MFGWVCLYCVGGCICFAFVCFVFVVLFVCFGILALLLGCFGLGVLLFAAFCGVAVGLFCSLRLWV